MLQLYLWMCTVTMSLFGVGLVIWMMMDAWSDVMVSLTRARRESVNFWYAIAGSLMAKGMTEDAKRALRHALKLENSGPESRKGFTRSETVNTQQLRPCHFCHEEDEIGVNIADDDTSVFVECRRCWASGPICKHDIHEESVRGAKAFWNREREPLAELSVSIVTGDGDVAECST